MDRNLNQDSTDLNMNLEQASAQEEQPKAGSKNKEIFTASFIRKLIVYFLLMVFFVSIIVLYYVMLYSQTKKNITDRGRVNAIESSTQIEQCFSPSADSLSLAGFTVDSMLMDSKKNEEIVDYLSIETVAIQNSLAVETTGFYGYINGEYLDGAGWVPDADYVATERPWYKEGTSGNGEVVIGDPYLDSETGKYVITISRMLGDGESVIAIDITLDQLQAITEEQIVGSDVSIQFIVNLKGNIIANSDRGSIGISLEESSNSILTSISKRIDRTESNFFYLKNYGRNYMVYVMPIQYDWTCVTVIDATDSFNRLRVPLLITIFVCVIMVGVLAILLLRAELKSREAQEYSLKSELAAAASEAKTSFLSNMSHEIRTPINAILGMNEMVLRESDDDVVLAYSENIKHAGKSLLGIVNDILDFSKIEAGKMEIIPLDYDLTVTLLDLVNMIGPRAEQKGLVFETDFDKDMPVLLNGDEVRLKQIIMNILSNAVKYTEKGCVKFRMACEKVPYEIDKVILKVSVEDTGIGIREKDMSRLFLDFERIEEERNRNIEGTGLGLGITVKLLALMGSSLEATSEYGKGSVFSFSLKQRVRDWVPLGDFDAARSSKRLVRKKYREKLLAPDARVLVVDDYPMNLAVFEGLVRQTKVKTDKAGSGDEGLRLAAKNKYDLIFLDHLMPVKDGVETLHELRESINNPNRETKVICLTANAVVGAKEEYLATGFDDYITKPIDFEKLELLLIKYLPEEKVTVVPATETEEEPDTEYLDKLSKLSGQDMIDTEVGIKNSGSPEAYISLLNIFYESVDENLRILGDSLENEKLEDYTIRVHAVKSSARIVGALRLGDEAQKLEDAGKSKDVVYVKEHSKEFLEHLAKVKDICAPVFNEDDENASDKPIASRVLMNDAYEQLREAADSMDCDALEEVFAQMKDYRIPEEEAELFEELKHASDRFEYDRILELLEAKK